MSKIEENKELVRRITEAKNANDAEKLRQCFSPDFVAHICGFSKPLNKKEYIEAIQHSHKAFSSFVIVIDEMIAEDVESRLDLQPLVSIQGNIMDLNPLINP